MFKESKFVNEKPISDNESNEMINNTIIENIFFTIFKFTPL